MSNYSWTYNRGQWNRPAETISRTQAETSPTSSAWRVAQSNHVGITVQPNPDRTSFSVTVEIANLVELIHATDFPSLIGLLGELQPVMNMVDAENADMERLAAAAN